MGIAINAFNKHFTEVMEIVKVRVDQENKYTTKIDLEQETCIKNDTKYTGEVFLTELS